MVNGFATGALPERLDEEAGCPGLENDACERECHEAYGHGPRCCKRLRQCSECFQDDACDAPREAL